MHDRQPTSRALRTAVRCPGSRYISPSGSPKLISTHRPRNWKDLSCQYCTKFKACNRACALRGRTQCNMQLQRQPEGTCTQPGRLGHLSPIDSWSACDTMCADTCNALNSACAPCLFWPSLKMHIASTHSEPRSIRCLWRNNKLHHHPAGEPARRVP